MADQNYSDGMHYFRTKVADLAGNYSYSNSISVDVVTSAPTATTETIYTNDSGSFLAQSSWLLKNDISSGGIADYVYSVSGSASNLSFDYTSFTVGTDNKSFTYTLNDSAGNVASPMTDTVTRLGSDNMTTTGSGGIYVMQHPGGVVTSAAGNDIISFQTAGSVVGLGNGGDALDVSTNVAVTATISSSGFVANSYTHHGGSGIVTINTAGYAVDFSASTGSYGYTINNTSATGATLVGSNSNDIIKGGTGSDTLTGGAGADTFVLPGSTISANGTDTITDFISGTDFLKLSAAGTTALTSPGSVATFLEYSITQVGNGVALDLSSGDLNGSNDGSPTFASTDVISFANLNSSNGTLSSVTNGTELLKLLATNGNSASGITIAASANNADYLIAYDDNNAYIYHAADAGGSPVNTIASTEIALIGIVQGVAPGGIHSGDVILGA